MNDFSSNNNMKVQTQSPPHHSQQQQNQQDNNSNNKPSPAPVVDLSIWKFLDPNEPWILVENGSFLNFFDFVPHHYRHGPWSMSALLGFPSLLYMLSIGYIWIDAQKPIDGWYSSSSASSSSSSVLNYDYAYTMEWYYTIIAFCWMVYICYNVYAYSPLSSSAWISFTLWSWTIITIRHGLCVLAPFVVVDDNNNNVNNSSSFVFLSRIVTLTIEIIRFPCLLSASMTFVIWNFVLFPIILLLLIRDKTDRMKFFGYMTNFRLTQLHVFNIWFAISNTVLIKPVRPLHLGDIVAIAIMMITYMIWYYFVLDRLGIHLYPIFTPRSPFVPFSWMLIIVVCLGGYHLWKDIIETLLLHQSEGGGGDDDTGMIQNLRHFVDYFLN